jgi:DNA-binding CsgD family transcriptional regulator/PAS domain-containing protein
MPVEPTMIDREVIDQASYTEVVGDIYDCVLEPSRWSGTLARIASLTQSASSSVIIHDAFDSKGGSIFEYGADQKYLRLYYERFATADLRSPAEQVRGVGELATLEMLCRGEPPLAADFFNDFIKPQGFGDLIAIELLRSGRRMGWLSTARSGIQLRYREQERQLMKLLSPHLCQALALSDAIDLVTLTSDGLQQTVDALSAGVFLTDREGRIVYMNKSAERQINTGNALLIVNRRLTSTDQKTNVALGRALAAKACTDAAASPSGSALALPDNSGAGYLASVLPLDGGARRELMTPFRASAGVFVQDPTATPRTNGEAFAQLYGLTGAELRVLITLAPGVTAKEAAKALGVREPTIKTHLQRIYEKTGMSRQSELVRLLLSHAPPLRH